MNSFRNKCQGGLGSFRLRFVHGTAWAVLVLWFRHFLSGKGSRCMSVQVWQKGAVPELFRFPQNCSSGSGSAFNAWKDSSDGSGFRFQFCSWTTLSNGVLGWGFHRRTSCAWTAWAIRYLSCSGLFWGWEGSRNLRHVRLGLHRKWKGTRVGGSGAFAAPSILRAGSFTSPCSW